VKKVFKKSVWGGAFVSILLGCAVSTAAPMKPLKVGVTAGPHADIMAFVKAEAAAQDLDIQIIEFNDFILPNVALNEGELDANSYQHQSFLNEQNEARGMKLVSVANTIVLPLGAYAQKLQKIEDVPYGAKVAIPNDASNAGRSLKLLEKAGLLTLQKEAPASPSILDIETNPKHLKIVEVEAPQVPRAMEDVDLALINTDWVLVAGLDPKKALIREDANSPYVNILVVRAGDEKRTEILKLVALYQSPKTQAFIERTFGGAVMPAWSAPQVASKAKVCEAK
jgi:D-methionine transport system substrate-binding protein